MPAPDATPPAHAAGTFTIGGALTVHRLGFGAMRLTGAGIWGPPSDPAHARDLLREAVRLGVDFIDTAAAYGPHVSEYLIAEALHPYPTGLVIATKGGVSRSGPTPPHPSRPDGRPERLRQDCEGSLKRLRVERIDLWQLHRIDPAVPIEEQFGVIRALQDEGKIRYVGVSEVTLDQLQRARALIEIVTVQNRFNYADRAAQDVLAVCEAEGLGFIPWGPLTSGDLARPGGALADAAHRVGVTPAQIALAWLLRRSPVMLPIPGTGSMEHLRENVDAALIDRSDDAFAALG